MPQVTASVHVPIPPGEAFAVSQTTGELRLRWDPFISRQYFLDGAVAPAKGVRTRTHAKLGPRMTSEYVSYRPPTSVGMTMVTGPWFFSNFGGGWRFTAHEDGTRAVWKYTFTVAPRWAAFAGDAIGTWLLGREIRKRIDAFARACTDPEIVAAATVQHS